MNAKKYLPIGTVIKLKNGKKRLMIIGYTPVDIKKEKKIYDYSGCLYPEGMINTTTILFNHEDIKDIFYLGYQDKEMEQFQKMLLSLDKKEIIEKL